MGGEWGGGGQGGGGIASVGASLFMIGFQARPHSTPPQHVPTARPHSTSPQHVAPHHRLPGMSLVVCALGPPAVMYLSLKGEIASLSPRGEDFLPSASPVRCPHGTQALALVRAHRRAQALTHHSRNRRDLSVQRRRRAGRPQPRRHPFSATLAVSPSQCQAQSREDSVGEGAKKQSGNEGWRERYIHILIRTYVHSYIYI